MSEVRVDVTGDASNLNRMFDDIERRARQLGANVDKIGLGGSSGVNTQRMRSQEVIGEAVQKQIQDINRQYQSNPKVQRLNELNSRIRSGSATDAEKKERAGLVHETAKFREERNEKIQNLEDEQTNLLRAIKEALTDNQKIQREQRQEGNAEFESKKSEGILGKLLNERGSLNRDLITASTKSEQEAVQKRLKEVNGKISEIQAGAGQDGEGTIGGARMVSNAMHGNVGNIASSLLAKLGPWGIAAGIIGGATIGLGTKGNQTLQSMYDLRALQGNGKDPNFINGFRESLFGGAGRDLSSMGLSQMDMVAYAGKMARTSGSMAGIDSRAFKSLTLEKGLGVQDLSQYAVFERQERNMQTVAENTLDLVNVMTSIDKSGLKKDDLTQLGEKLQTQNKVLSYQFQRQEVVSNKEATVLMGAFAKLGGSGADQRAGDFISKTMGAFGESGDANTMAYKYYLAKKAHPELANNPAALNRLVEQGTDLKYVQTGLTDMTSRYSGNDQYFMFKRFFPGLTPDQRDKLMSLGKTGGISKMMEQYEQFKNNGLTQDVVEGMAKDNTTSMTKTEQLAENTLTEAQMKVAQGINKMIDVLTGNDPKMKEVIKQAIQEAGKTPIPKKAIYNTPHGASRAGM